MIDKTEAQRIADQHLAELSESAKTELVFTDVQEQDWGWLYFYQSASFAETGAIGDMLAGNAPFIVARETGMVTTLGTAKPVEDYVADYVSAHS
ncbi:YrhB domain-containing protein [Parasphingorhabdus cellanae]|uniref:Immunity protein 35 domain-containing protein n=1 Tax=Parasphingorhabdus cellanae TaxID=2806553 RepID=A0ABX7T1V8_9SPHN|nr:YrhB domain-containing protein [Parasphingorhabdus cellanae]QTD55551.1 hypothetical protein J4G78_15310 [Parasphingorhabdus cellanae]